MTDDKPEPTAVERLTAAMDELMATVLRHLRTGQGNPLEEPGLEKAKAVFTLRFPGRTRFPRDRPSRPILLAWFADGPV